jgi:hypothetical protein
VTFSRVLLQLILLGGLALWAWLADPLGYVACLVGLCVGIVARSLWDATARWERAP